MNARYPPPEPSIGVYIRNSAMLLTNQIIPTEKKPFAVAERSGMAPRYFPIRKGAPTSIISAAMLAVRPIM